MSTWIKLNLLLCALVLALAVMVFLNQNGLPAGLRLFLGL